MGYNRSGVKFVARMKKRRHEAMRLAKKAGEIAKAAPQRPPIAPTEKKAAKPK